MAARVKWTIIPDSLPSPDSLPIPDSLIFEFTTLGSGILSSMESNRLSIDLKPHSSNYAEYFESKMLVIRLATKTNIHCLDICYHNAYKALMDLIYQTYVHMFKPLERITG